MGFYDTYLRLCKSKGMTPSAVAEDIGLQKSNVSRWKNGSIPTDRNLLRIAEYFDVPVNYLRGDDVVILSDERQDQLLDLLSQAINDIKEEPTRVFIEIKIDNFLPRLKRHQYHRASKEAIYLVADYLGIHDAVSAIIENVSPPKYNCGVLTCEEEALIFNLRSMEPETRSTFFSLFDAYITRVELKMVCDFRSLNSDGQNYVLQTIEMARMSYSEKNNASPILEEAN